MNHFAAASQESDSQDPLRERQSRRARYLLLATGTVMLVIGIGWALFFLAKGARVVALCEFGLALLGILVIITAHSGRVRLSAWLAFAGLFIFLCLFSALLDLQTSSVPRSSHLFLVVMAVCAHYVFRGEKPWLRYGTVCLFLAAFVWFAAMASGPAHDYAISDEVRSTGVWVNLASMVISLLVVLHLQESDSAAHRTLLRELRDALASRQFELFYQPQIDANGTIVGAEALLRWRDPKHGLVRPQIFVQAAEETGFILPLGQWVLLAACERLGAWKDNPQLCHLRLSINVSALQLQQPDFVAQVLEALQRSDVDAHALTLELTESVLLNDMATAIARMQTLQEAGVRTSLDDFGTGYSSLSYLRKMPLSELKIDRVFVAEVTHDANAASIARTLLQLGRDLGMEVIAEGIEQQAQYEFLREQGCGLFQGYLFGKPMEVSRFEQLVTDSAQTRQAIRDDTAGSTAHLSTAPSKDAAML